MYKKNENTTLTTATSAATRKASATPTVTTKTTTTTMNNENENEQRSKKSSKDIYKNNNNSNISNNVLFEDNDTFNARIIKEAVSSITIDWNLIVDAEVYEIEKYHPRRGWQNAAWITSAPTVVENLDENFAYRFRIKALKFEKETPAFVVLKTSKEFIGCTDAALPSTICLFLAIERGQRFRVKRILTRRQSLVEYPGPNGDLPLANAIKCNENRIIDVLLTAGASAHIGNPVVQRTPLHFAFYYGRLPVARILLNRRADINARDVNGMTPSHFAVDANQYEILKFAIENGADIEAKDGCGWTLLLRAVVMEANLNIVKLLIMQGANTGAVDKMDQDCEDLARLFKNEVTGNYFERLFKIRKKDEK